MIRLSIAHKLFLSIVVTISMVTLLGYSVTHFVMGGQVQTPNQPIKAWQYTHLIKPLTEHIKDDIEISDFSSLQPFCDTNKELTVKDLGQDYAKVTITNITITDIKGFTIWQCPLLSAPKNAFTSLPIKSRDDLADALSGEYNVGVERVDDGSYLVVKPIRNQRKKIIGSLISKQSWHILKQESPWLHKLPQFINYLLGFGLVNLLWILPSAAVLTWLLTRGLNKQLIQIMTTIDLWGEGQLNARIYVKGNDQVAQSLDRLNRLAQDFQQSLQEKTMLAETRERQRIAAELHDTVKQLLFANNLQLGACQQADISEQAKGLIQQAITNNQQAFQQINQLIDTLKPLDFIGEGFWPALTTMIESWASQQNTVIEKQIEDVELTAEQSHILYRAVQEALQNINKHADPTQISVSITRQAEQCTVKVSNDGVMDGKGYKEDGSGKMENFKHQTGQGLRLMQQRLETIGGKLDFSLNSDNKMPATLTVQFPLKAEQPDD